MNLDFSFGIVPLKQSKEWYVFLIKHTSGHWGFPKGHKEDKDETNQDAAKRELNEETGLKVSEFLPIAPFVEKYMFTFKGMLQIKEVTYYPALVYGVKKLDPVEVAEGDWFTLEDAYKKLTFPESKGIIKKLTKLLNAKL